MSELWPVGLLLLSKINYVLAVGVSQYSCSGMQEINVKNWVWK